MKNLIHAARPLANDLGSSLLFALMTALGVPPMVATACAMALGVGHVILWKTLGKPIAPLQWASLALVLVFGSAGLLLHDPRFVMAKPTVIYAIIAAVMAKRGWMLRYLPPIASGHGDGLMVAFGYVWAGLMALTAVSNLVVAIWFAKAWPLYIAIWPTASKLALFAIQYATVRLVVRRKIIAQRQATELALAQAV